MQSKRNSSTYDLISQTLPVSKPRLHMKTFNHKAQDSLSKEIYERVKIDFSELKNKSAVKASPSVKLGSSLKVE